MVLLSKNFTIENKLCYNAINRFKWAEIPTFIYDRGDV